MARSVEKITVGRPGADGAARQVEPTNWRDAESTIREALRGSTLPVSLWGPARSKTDSTAKVMIISRLPGDHPEKEPQHPGDIHRDARLRMGPYEVRIEYHQHRGVFIRSGVSTAGVCEVTRVFFHCEGVHEDWDWAEEESM